MNNLSFTTKAIKKIAVDLMNSNTPDDYENLVICLLSAIKQLREQGVNIAKLHSDNGLCVFYSKKCDYGNIARYGFTKNNIEDIPKMVELLKEFNQMIIDNKAMDQKNG